MKMLPRNEKKAAANAKMVLGIKAPATNSYRSQAFYWLNWQLGDTLLCSAQGLVVHINLT